MLDLARDRTLYLDTNILIYAFEPGHSGATSFRSIFEMIDAGATKALTSELTLAEVLALPLRQGAQDMVDRYELLLSPESPIGTIPIDRTILRGAALLRANRALKLADALHVATALQHGCDYFFTEDQRLGDLLPEGVPRLSLAMLENA